MKRLVRILVACLALLIVFGSLPVQSNSNQVTLKYSMWDVQLKELEEETIIKPFEESHPNIKIDFQPMPWDEYWKRIQTSVAANDPYDVFYMSVAYTQEFARKGMIMNLQPYLDESVDLRTLTEFDAVLDILRYEGDLYAFPYAWVCSLLYYNKDMFDAAGVDYPTDDWTFDDMWDAAAQLTSGEGPGKQYGIHAHLGHPFLDAYINAAGGYVLNDDFSKCLVDEPEAVAAIQDIYNRIYVDGVSPSPASLQGQPNPFLSGRVAMYIEGSYMIDTYRTITDFDWDVVMVPKNAETDKRVVYGGPDSMVVASNTQYPDEALEFLMYYCAYGRDISSYMGGKVPISRVLAEEEEWLEIGQKPENKIAILKSAPFLKGADFSYKWMEWRFSIMGSELANAFEGNVTIQEACDTTAIETNKILAEIQ